MIDGEQTYSSDGPTCPYCGFVVTPDEGFYYDQARYEDDECPECERRFVVQIYHSVSWECTPIEEPDKR